jgi:hypothetical protein
MEINIKNVDELTRAFAVGIDKWIRDNSLKLIEPIQFSNLPITEYQPEPAMLIWMAVQHIITGETKGVGIPIGKRFGKAMPDSAAELVKKVADELTLAFWPNRVAEI